MVVCLSFPRFELAVAAGGRSRAGRQALAGRPLAIAPAPGGPRRVGEVSGAAQAHGVVAGMALGEALARCPSLRLLPADPLGVAEAWEAVLMSLEGIGARVEAPAPGIAYFQADGLLRLHGGGLDRVIAAAGAACRAAGTGGPSRKAGGEGPGRATGAEGVSRTVGRASASGFSPRIGVGPARFCALAAALCSHSRAGATVVDERSARRWLASQPVELLRHRAQTEPLLLELQRLGVRTLGDLLALGRDRVADRFGAAGVLAHRLAAGEEEPLRPRRAPERLRETLELEQADSGPALERILGVLIARLLARPERRGRTLRAVTLSARLVEGGTWRERVVFREALGEAERMRIVLAPRLAKLPAPAEALRLAVACFGPASGEQRDLLGQRSQARAAKLGEAVVQARAAAGPDAALRIVLVEDRSRVPERRAVLAPFQAPTPSER